MDHHDHHGHHMMQNITSTTGMPTMTGHEHHDHAAMHHGMDHGGMDHDGMDHSGMDHGGMHMAMKMYFHFSLTDIVLFDFWKVDSTGSLISSMIGIFIAAMLYEGLKYFREYLYWKNYNTLQYSTVHKPQAQENERVINNYRSYEKAPMNFLILDSTPSYKPSFFARKQPSLVSDVIHRQPPKLLNAHHILQTGLHIIQILVSYLLMLIFMTYNVWLCIAVVLGSATGYFLFGWRKSLFVDVTEHCH